MAPLPPVEVDPRLPTALTLQFYRRDPVMVFLRDRLGLTTRGAVVGIILLSVLIMLVVPLLLPRDPNALATQAESLSSVDPRTPQGIISLLKSTLLEGGVVLPLAVLLYFLLPGLFAEQFTDLAQNGVISKAPSSKEFARFLRRAAVWIDSPIWAVLGLAVVGAYWFFRLNYCCDFSSNLPTSHAWQVFNRILLLVNYTLPLYGGGLTIGRLAAGLYFTGYLFQNFELEVNLLHPDKAGGLGIVGRNLIGGILFAVLLGLAAVGIGLVAVGTDPLVTSRPEGPALGLVYLILTPLLLFFWLWIPHRALLRARKRALLPLSEAFQKAYAGPGGLAPSDPAALKAHTDRLMEIKRQYDFIEDAFPTWPLPRPVVRNLLATASLPTISSILTLVFPNMPEIIRGLLKIFGAR